MSEYKKHIMKELNKYLEKERERKKKKTKPSPKSAVQQAIEDNKASRQKALANAKAALEESCIPEIKSLDMGKEREQPEFENPKSKSLKKKDILNMMLAAMKEGYEHQPDGTFAEWEMKDLVQEIFNKHMNG